MQFNFQLTQLVYFVPDTSFCYNIIMETVLVTGQGRWNENLPLEKHCPFVVIVVYSGFSEQLSWPLPEPISLFNKWKSKQDLEKQNTWRRRIVRKKRPNTATGPMTMTTCQRLNTASGCSSGCGAITMAMWAGRAGCSCPRRTFLRPLTSPLGVTRWAAHHQAAQQPQSHPAAQREDQHSRQVTLAVSIHCSEEME